MLSLAALLSSRGAANVLLGQQRGGARLLAAGANRKGGAEQAEEASSGYVYADAEEAEIEAERPLHPFVAIPMAEPVVSRIKSQAAARLLFMHRFYYNKKLLKAFEPIYRQQVEQRAQLIREQSKEQRSQKKAGGPARDPNSGKYTFDFTKPLSGSAPQVRQELAFLEENYTKVIGLQGEFPNKQPHHVLSQLMPEVYGYQFPESRDWHFLRPMLHEFYCQPQHVLNYQANMKKRDLEKYPNEMLHPLFFQFAMHRSQIRAINTAREQLKAAGFADDDIMLPDRLPDMSATRLYESVEYENYWVPSEKHDHIYNLLHPDEVRNRTVMKRYEQKEQMRDQSQANEMLDDKMEINKKILPSVLHVDDDDDGDDGDGADDGDSGANAAGDVGGDLAVGGERHEGKSGAFGAYSDDEDDAPLQGGHEGESAAIFQFDEQATVNDLIATVYDVTKRGLMDKPLVVPPCQRLLLDRDIDRIEALGRPDPSARTAIIDGIRDPVLRRAVKRAMAATDLYEFQRREEALDRRQLSVHVASQLNERRGQLEAVEQLKDPNISRVERLMALLSRDGPQFTDFELAEECLREASMGNPKYRMSTDQLNHIYLVTQTLATLQASLLDETARLPNSEVAQRMRLATSATDPLNVSTRHMSQLHHLIEALITNEYDHAVRGAADLAFFDEDDEDDDAAAAAAAAADNDNNNNNNNNNNSTTPLPRSLERSDQLPPLIEQFPNGTDNTIQEVFGDNATVEIGNFRELLADIITHSIDDRETELDRFAYEGTKAQKKNTPIVGEFLVHRPTRQHLGKILRASFNMFVESEQQLGDDRPTRGLIYDIGKAWNRSAASIQDELDTAAIAWTEQKELHSPHAVSEVCHRIFTAPASLGIHTTEGQAELERSARQKFLNQMVVLARQRTVDADTPLSRRTMKTLDFLHSLGEQLPKPEDKRMIQVMELLHLHLFEVASYADKVRQAPAGAYPDRDVIEAEARVNADQFADYLTIIENWMDARKAAGVPGPDNPRPVHRKPRLKDFGVSVTSVEYVDPMGPQIQQRRVKLYARKVAFHVDVAALKLSPAARHRLAKLAGPRYDAQTQTLRVVADKYPNSRLNHRYAIQMIRRLITEAWKADPAFVPLSDLALSDPAEIMATQPEAPAGRLLPDEYFDGTLLSISSADVESLKDRDYKWRLKQLIHQWCLFRVQPYTRHARNVLDLKKQQHRKESA